MCNFWFGLLRHPDIFASLILLCTGTVVHGSRTLLCCVGLDSICVIASPPDLPYDNKSGIKWQIDAAGMDSLSSSPSPAGVRSTSIFAQMGSEGGDGDQADLLPMFASRRQKNLDAKN